MPLVKLRSSIRGNAVDVDLFLAETPFQQEIVKRRKQVETLDGTIWIASPEDVVLLKLIANRNRDKSEIQDVLFTQGELDRDYLLQWSEHLKIRDRLEVALDEFR
jgi:hypothetical protein